ncbi:glycosyltransferase family 4 protein [Candidatus Jorgensenbacteria bacterium]|nr:glycosyltransferase family 4 protein [Candidatus Jorgensenbacteria bacterium]
MVRIIRSSTVKNKKKIIFVFPTNRKKLIGEVRRRVTPDNGLYGLNHLQGSFDIETVEVSTVWERILNLLLLPVTIFFNSEHTRLNLGRMILALYESGSADLAVTCVDSVSKAACLLKKFGIMRQHLVCMAGNVLDGTERLIFLHRWLLSGADLIVTHAPVDQEKLTGLGLRNGVCIPVGSDASFYQKHANSEFPASPARGRIQNLKLVVSIGADRDRDYQTLFLAASQLPQLKFIVCCGRKNVESLKIPDNVDVRTGVSSTETKNILAKAELIVIPLKETYRASGQLAMLDAMLIGKPVIVSRTRGTVESYGLIDKKHILLSQPEDAEDLVRDIKNLQSSRKLRQNLGEAGRKLALGYTTMKYAEKLKKIILASD